MSWDGMAKFIALVADVKSVFSIVWSANELTRRRIIPDQWGNFIEKSISSVFLYFIRNAKLQSMNFWHKFFPHRKIINLWSRERKINIQISASAWLDELIFLFKKHRASASICSISRWNENFVEFWSLNVYDEGFPYSCNAAHDSSHEFVCWYWTFDITHCEYWCCCHKT